MASAKKVVEISVKIGAFPGGQLKSYVFNQGQTYRDGLSKASLNSNDKSLDVRVNGKSTSSLDGEMQDGDQILVFSKVRGN